MIDELKGIMRFNRSISVETVQGRECTQCRSIETASAKTALARTSFCEGHWLR